jgi:hypothetical protein
VLQLNAAFETFLDFDEQRPHFVRELVDTLLHERDQLAVGHMSDAGQNVRVLP